MKRLIIFLALLSCLTILLVACQSNTTPDTPNTVHMDDSVFLTTAVTIKKGQNVIMKNDFERNSCDHEWKLDQWFTISQA